MDDLMSEATGLVLASNRDLTTTELIKVSDWESRRNSTDLTSLTLLRLSISNSIKDNRNTQSEEADIIPSKQTKDRQHKGSSLKKTKVDVQFLDPEENVSVSALPDKNRDLSIDIRDQNKSEQDSESVPILQPLLKDTEEDGLGLLHLEMSDEDDKSNVSNKNDNKTETNDKQQQESRKKIVDISLKLASRKFSDGIFENCSTYGLACPEVLQEKDHCTTPASTAEENQPPASDLANEVTVGRPLLVSSLAEDPTTDVIDCQKNVSSMIDDQISLSDSFFVNVVNGDPQNVFSKESNIECSSPGTKNSSRASLSIAKENNIQNLELSTVKSERRLSRRSRRRHRKSKSKITTPTYECPKCGVSYILSSSASNITARCLHCDFWTSVEPVFMKREKQPWNTCRIC